MFGQDAQNPLTRKPQEGSDLPNLSSKRMHQAERPVERGLKRFSTAVLSGRPFGEYPTEQGLEELDQNPSQKMDCEYDAAWERMQNINQSFEGVKFHEEIQPRPDHFMLQEPVYFDQRQPNQLHQERYPAPIIPAQYQDHGNPYPANYPTLPQHPPRYGAVSRQSIQPTAHFVQGPPFHPAYGQYPAPLRDEKAHLINMFSSFLHQLENPNH